MSSIGTDRPTAKGQLEEPLPAIARMLGDFLQHQRNNPVPDLILITPLSECSKKICILTYLI